jgi:hypothetical protein
MKIDCTWFHSNLEAYFCDTLDETGRQAAVEHLQQCDSCKNEVASLEGVDQTVRQVFKYRLANASAKQVRHVRFLPLAAGVSVAAAALLLAINLPNRETLVPTAVQWSAPTVPADNIPPMPVAPLKNAVEPPIQRAKPTDENPTSLQPRPDLDAAKSGAPDFAVIDAAGYSAGLENFKGYFVVVGIWSQTQPETIQALNRIYSAVGQDQQVRVLGVASTRQEPLDQATFPVVFNRGSHLLGLKAGGLMLLDKAGHVRWNGTLTESPESIVSKIRSQIDSRR